MQDEFCLWLNANSLVLLPRTWDAANIDAQLDVQLAALIMAEHEFSMFHEYADWCSEYRACQGALGCSVVGTQPANDPDWGSQPLNGLREALFAALPAQYREGVIRCLGAFRLPPEHAALKAMWNECVLPSQSGNAATVATELRVVIPGISVVSAQLKFYSHVAVETDWLWHRFEPETLTSINAQCTQYLINDVVLDSIRDELRHKYALLRSECSQKIPMTEQ